MRHLILFCLLSTVLVLANASPRIEGKGKQQKNDPKTDEGGKSKGKGKFAGMTKEERSEFMKKFREDKEGRRTMQEDRIKKWRQEESAKGKRRKETDDQLPPNHYTALVDGKPMAFRGIMKTDKPDLQAEPEVVQNQPETALKEGKFKKLSGKSKGPKADGVGLEDFEQVSRKGRKKMLGKLPEKKVKKWEERVEKRKGKGQSWKKRQEQRQEKGKGKTQPETSGNQDSQGRGKGKLKYRSRRETNGFGAEPEAETELVRRRRAETYTQANKLWPSPFITYVFGPTFGSTYRANVRKAMDMWESNSCLKFLEAKTEPTDEEPYIYIDTIDLNACWADRLGIKGTKPRKTMVNAGWCRTEVGSLAHELGHVLGLSHSQKRTDRDHHIRVYLDRIDNDWRGQYEKNPDFSYDDYGIPYYYESLMHYPPTFNGDTVICALDPLTEIRMGQRAKITFKDYAFVNKLYCEEECLDEYELGKHDFKGSILSQTISGRVCQNWTDNYPHDHDYARVGDHNYCRNPDRWEAGPWCYTTDIDVRYEPCISSCQQLARFRIPSCEGYCHNGGFFNAMCSCVCPPYASGEHCEVVDLKEKYGYMQCGGKIELDESGTLKSIQSDNYPYQYPASHLCKWWIQAPPGMFVAMEVVDFDLEAPSGGSCAYDYLQIETSNCPDNPPSKEEIRFCAQVLKSDQTYYEYSRTRDLIITFKSDDTVQHNGFKLQFTAFK